MTQRDDMIAALERAIAERATSSDHVAHYLRALAEALREAKPGQFYNEVSQLTDGWFIPVPKVKP